MKIAFVGSQTGMTKWQEGALAQTFKRLNISELVIRDYIGSDATAIDIAIKIGVKNFHIFPINDSKKRAFRFYPKGELYKWLEHKLNDGSIVYYKLEPVAAPLTAAQNMVEVSECCVAAPKEMAHTLRSGTWGAIRKFWHKKKEVITLPALDRDFDESSV